MITHYQRGASRAVPTAGLAKAKAFRSLRMLRLSVALVALAAAVFARAAPVAIVAAESVYGDIARQIGGDDVSVASILAGSGQDPHEFAPGAAEARAVAHARIVVMNGADYDAWMTKLASASPSRSRETIDVAQLAGRRSGDNPHVWYDTAAISALARALADTLSRIDPAHRAAYAGRLDAFDASMRPLAERIRSMRDRYAGTPVTATEPVFGYMAGALGLDMRNARFQLAVMNGSEPAPRDVAAFENDLRRRLVRVLIFNRQTTGPLADRMRALATSSGVPVVGVDETEPADTTYVRWMLGQLDALDAALSGKSR